MGTGKISSLFQIMSNNVFAGVASYPSGCWSVALTLRLKAFPIGLPYMVGWDGMVTGAGAGHEAIVVLSEKEKNLI